MSDTSQGPGWWQASDGLWYAPEAHPNYQPPAPAPAPPAPVQESSGEGKPFYKKKRVIIPGAILALFIVIGLAGGGSDGEDDVAVEAIASEVEEVEEESPEIEEESSEATTTEAPQETTTTEAATTTTEAQADLGTEENPYPFGQAHSRDPGFLGAGWSISIDEVRTEGIDRGRFADESLTGTCVAVIGSATLESLDSEELTSNIFGFPSVVLIENGSLVDSNATECNWDSLEAEGLTWVLDVSLAEGGSTKWFQVFLLDDVNYDLVAIESTVYGG